MKRSATAILAIAAMIGAGTFGFHSVAQVQPTRPTLEKRVKALEDAFPSGTVLFTQQRGCPAGFVEMIALRGRYVVGLPTGGDIGAAVGKELSNQERRNTVAYHEHTINKDLLKHTHAVNAHALRSQPGAPGVAEGSHVPFTGVPVTGAANFEAGTIKTDANGVDVNTNDLAINAPYLQLLACVRS